MSQILIDTLPYQVFKKIKDRYAQHTLLITPEDITKPGVIGAYPNVEAYVTAMFRMAGYEVYRYKHDYDSLPGDNPKMGIVFLANDSVLVPGMEAIGLIGHNIRPIADGESKYTDA